MLDLTRWFANVQPLWLQRALDLSTSEVPSGLIVDRDPASGKQSPPIVPTIDAYQSGIGIAELFPTNQLALDVATPTALVTPAADPVVTGLLVSLGLQASAFAAPRQFRVSLVMPGVVATTLFFGDVATLATVGWAAIAGSADARIWIPPGFQIQVAALNLVAAEAITVDAIVVTLPAGFKPF